MGLLLVESCCVSVCVRPDHNRTIDSSMDWHFELREWMLVAHKRRLIETVFCVSIEIHFQMWFFCRQARAIRSNSEINNKSSGGNDNGDDGIDG